MEIKGKFKRTVEEEITIKMDEYGSNNDIIIHINDLAFIFIYPADSTVSINKNALKQAKLKLLNH